MDSCRDGIPLIRWNHFQDYCEELVIECGYIPDGLPEWIAEAIDWEIVAENLKQDYFEVSIFGIVYYYR